MFLLARPPKTPRLCLVRDERGTVKQFGCSGGRCTQALRRNLTCDGDAVDSCKSLVVRFSLRVGKTDGFPQTRRDGKTNARPNSEIYDISSGKSLR